MKDKTILAIDDNQPLLTALRYTLEGVFGRVLTLASPDDVLRVIGQEQPDILLLDMNFTLGVNTGQDGLFWLRTIKKRHPELPIVLMTAYAEVDLAVKGLKSGASDFVTKPWDNDELLEKLRAVLAAQDEVATLDTVEQDHIRRALDKCHGNMKLAADMLGITRQTLYNKLKQPPPPTPPHNGRGVNTIAMLPIIIIILIVALAAVAFFRHQRKLKTRAWLMREAIRNRDFMFRLSSKGLFFGEKAMQEALNDVGQELRWQIAANEVESWKKLTRVLTHEIMNATAPIASISQAFLNRSDVRGTAIEDGIKAIHETSLGLSSFVENYRKLTALQKPNPTTFGLREMAENVVRMYPDMEWRIEIPEDAMVTADETLLRQVLINLAKNAKEADAARISLALRPSAASGRDSGLLFSNDGRPIPSELCRDIFTPFFTTKKTGSGIGLSLSRQIMVSMGGDLRLEDVPSPGYHATFILSLPLN